MNIEELREVVREELEAASRPPGIVAADALATVKPTDPMEQEWRGAMGRGELVMALSLSTQYADMCRRSGTRGRCGPASDFAYGEVWRARRDLLRALLDTMGRSI